VSQNFNAVHIKHYTKFLYTKAATVLARLSHRNFERPAVRLSVTRVDQSKTVQARITKSSPSAA